MAKAKAERLDTVDTAGCGTLVTEEATKGHGGTAVTVIVDAEVVIANRDGQLKKMLYAVHSCSLESDLTTQV